MDVNLDEASSEAPDAENPEPRSRLSSLVPQLSSSLTLLLLFIAPFIFLPMMGGVVFATLFGPAALLAGAQDHWPLQASIVAIACVLHLVSTRLYARQVFSIMRKQAGVEPTADADAQPQVQDPAREWHNVDDASPAEGASAALRFETYGQDAERLIDTDVEEFVRDRLLNLRGRIFFYAILAGLVFSLAIQLILSSTFMAAFLGVPESGPVPQADRSLLAWVQPFVSDLIAGGLAFLIYRHRLGVGIPTALFVGVCANLIWVIVGFGMWFDDSLSAEDRKNVVLILAPFVGYISVVILGGIAARRYGRQSEGEHLAGLRLLVLRVFGVDRNTESLFGFVVRRWPFLGPLVTIVDPTYASFVFSRARFVLLLSAAIPPLFLFALIQDVEAMWLFTLVTTAAYYACWLPLLFAWMVWRLKVSTGHNMAALTQRLAFERKSLFQKRYPAIRLVCFDDLWKSTMAHLVGWADVVLMDLRGFTSARQGCEYELAYLMDHCSLAKTLFLVDATTDTDLFRTTLRRQFGSVNPASPNAGQSEVKVHSYSASGSGRELRREIRPILAVLGDLATTDNASTATEASSSMSQRGAPLSREAQTVTRAIRVSWLVLALGFVAQFALSWDGIRLGSGLSIMWLGGIGLMLTTRMRRLLIRDGSLERLFHGRMWPSAFMCFAGSWLVWYVWIPLQN